MSNSDLPKISDFLPWASERFFPGGALGNFFQNFSRGAKSGEICFFALEIKKISFFAEIFKILPPIPTPILLSIT